MDLVTDISIESIVQIKRKRNQWIAEYCIESFASPIISKELLQEILFRKDCFIKINSYTIVNLNYIKDCLLNGTDGFVVIFDILYNVPRRFIPQVREAHKNFLYKKYQHLFPSDFGTTVSANDQILSDYFKYKIGQIKYFVRNGSSTTAFYEDGSKKVFYKTLKEFEQIFESDSNSFFRVRRNCIINTQFISCFKMASDTQTGIVEIGDFGIKISRRQLPSFRRKYIHNL